MYEQAVKVLGKHTQKGAGYLRLFIKRKLTSVLKPRSCNELGRHNPLPPPGALCGEKQVQCAGKAKPAPLAAEWECTGREREGRQQKCLIFCSQFNQKVTGGSTCLEPLFVCLFAWLFKDRCDRYPSRAQDPPQPKQWRLGGISLGQSWILVGK